MEKGRRHVDPEQMTSAERLDRIVEILVKARSGCIGKGREPQF